MTTLFSSGHGNKGAWLSCMSRKCCKDNRMCPGSAAGGRRIQGSYCTLWNELRNARCLPFLFFLHFLFWALSRITCWRRQALKIMRPRWMHVWHGAGTRMFAVTHLHIPRRRPEGFTDRNKTLPQQLFGWGTQASSQATEVDGKLVTWKNRSKYAPCNLTGRQLTTKTVIKFSAVSPSDRCRVSEKIKSRNTDQIASMSHLSLAFISWS